MEAEVGDDKAPTRPLRTPLPPSRRSRIRSRGTTARTGGRGQGPGRTLLLNEYTNEVHGPDRHPDTWVEGSDLRDRDGGLEDCPNPESMDPRVWSRGRDTLVDGDCLGPRTRSLGMSDLWGDRDRDLTPSPNSY